MCVCVRWGHSSWSRTSIFWELGWLLWWRWWWCKLLGLVHCLEINPPSISAAASLHCNAHCLYHCTVSLHSAIALCHNTVPVHRTIAPYHCTVPLHCTIALYQQHCSVLLKSLHQFEAWSAHCTSAHCTGLHSAGTKLSQIFCTFLTATLESQLSFSAVKITASMLFVCNCQHNVSANRKCSLGENVIWCGAVLQLFRSIGCIVQLVCSKIKRLATWSIKSVQFLCHWKHCQLIPSFVNFN